MGQRAQGQSLGSKSGGPGKRLLPAPSFLIYTGNCIRGVLPPGPRLPSPLLSPQHRAYRPRETRTRAHTPHYTRLLAHPGVHTHTHRLTALKHEGGWAVSPQHPAPRLRSAIRPASLGGCCCPGNPPRLSSPVPGGGVGLSVRSGPVWCHTEVGRAGDRVGPGGGFEKGQCQAGGPALTPLWERGAPVGRR